MGDVKPTTPYVYTKDNVLAGLHKLYHPSQFPSNLECVEYKNRSHATFQFKVDETTSSLANNMFGGIVGSLTDSLTVLLLLGERSVQVSTGINVSYFRPAPLHSRVTVECKALFLGSKSRNLEARFLNEEGKLIALGTHNLLVVTPAKL